MTNTSHRDSNMSDFNLFLGFILDQEKLRIPLLGKLCLYSCHYDNDYYSADLFKQLNIIYPEHISKSVKKRQAEYLAGRYSARLALNDLNIENFNVSTGQHRSPVWPQDNIGSITHTKCKAYAAAASCADFSYIGIDYEELIDTKTASNIYSIIANENEIKLIMDSNYDFTLALTIIFSAKESLFKALYPSVGHYFDFSAATMIGFVKDEHSFELKLHCSLGKNLMEDSRFKGWFQRESGHVLTVIACKTSDLI